MLIQIATGAPLAVFIIKSLYYKIIICFNKKSTFFNRKWRFFNRITHRSHSPPECSSKSCCLYVCRIPKVYTRVRQHCKLQNQTQDCFGTLYWKCRENVEDTLEKCVFSIENRIVIAIRSMLLTVTRSEASVAHHSGARDASAQQHLIRKITIGFDRRIEGLDCKLPRAGGPVACGNHHYSIEESSFSIAYQDRWFFSIEESLICNIRIVDLQYKNRWFVI